MPLPAWAACVATAAHALAWLELCNHLARRQAVDQTTARKLIHIGCGLQFLLDWLLFPDTRGARLLAGSVPLAAAARYAAVGAGLLQDASLVRSTSRTGERSDLLKGPVAYGVVHGLAAVLCWRRSAVGIVAIAILCAGDGSAELVGRRLGRRNPLPHNRSKSWAGSLACGLCGGATSLAFLLLFRWAGHLTLRSSLPALASRVAAVAAFTAGVESLPLPDWDNLTVAAAAAASSAALIS